MWIPIDEDAPLGRDVLLGWWETWPERIWKCEVGWIGKPNSYPGTGVSDGWLHGEATHYHALPSAPTPESDDAVRYFKAMIG